MTSRPPRQGDRTLRGIELGQFLVAQLAVINQPAVESERVSRMRQEDGDMRAVVELLADVG